MGVVYVIVNSAFENYVKIGKTTNLQQRLRSLDNTSVPLPFRCLYAVEVDDENHVEHLLHQVFADHRTRTTREFFEVDAQRVIAAMKLTGAKTLRHGLILLKTKKACVHLRRQHASRENLIHYSMPIYQ